jgi:nucleotide-binding universal stress UspA family protein
MQFNFEAMDRFLPEWEDKVKRSNDIKKYSPYYDEERKFSIEDPLCKQGNNILKEMAQYAEKLGVKPKTEVKLGKFVNTVIDVAQKGKYDQIIVGKTDFVGNKGLPTDNVFEKIAKYADCRVSVIPA